LTDHVYKKNGDGTETRIKRKRIIGPVADITKKKAEEEHRAWIRRVHALPAAETPLATVTALCDDYVQLREGDWRRHTLDTNLTIFALIKSTFGDWPTERVKPEDLKRFINSLPKRSWETPKGHPKTRCSESQAQKCIAYLRAIVDLAAERAAERGVLFRNPARSKVIQLTVPKGWRKPGKTVFSAAAIAAAAGPARPT
jgi:hypothetical protein